MFRKRIELTLRWLLAHRSQRKPWDHIWRDKVLRWNASECWAWWLALNKEIKDDRINSLEPICYSTNVSLQRINCYDGYLSAGHTHIKLNIPQSVGSWTMNRHADLQMMRTWFGQRHHSWELPSRRSQWTTRQRNHDTIRGACLSVWKRHMMITDWWKMLTSPDLIKSLHRGGNGCFW